MKRKRKAAAVIMAAMMIFCLAGCGGTGDAAGGADPQNGQETQAATDATQATQPATAQQGGQNGQAQNGQGSGGGGHDGNGHHHQNGVTDIGMDAAIAIALERIPGATRENVTEMEKDFDDGRIEYEGSIWHGGYEYEFEIDGSTGNLLKWEIDD